VTGNLIGTDSTGEADLGNALQGVEIDNASGVTVSGNARGSQVISGNQIGVEIDGLTSIQNLIQGNFIGVDKAGTADRGNSQEGVLIEGAFGNTVGGTTNAAANVISANQWGIRLDGPTATGNLIEGNLVGTDFTGTAPLGNEVNGILFTSGASNNTVGGTGGGQGNIIAFNVAAGVSVGSGTGDSILSKQYLLQRPARDLSERNGKPRANRAGGFRSERRRDRQQYPGITRERRRHHVLDPVLQQPGSRPVRPRPGPDIPGLDDRDDRCQRQCDHRLRPGERPCRRPVVDRHGHQPGHGRHLRVFQRRLGPAGER